MADTSLRYYHSLYHLVTHWAAYVATLGLLLTIGVVISASPKLGNRWYFVLAIIVASGASFFFLRRMHTFATDVNRILDVEADETKWLPGSLNLVIGACVTLAVAAMDFIALCLSAV
jgi:hypothetical protein